MRLRQVVIKGILLVRAGGKVGKLITSKQTKPRAEKVEIAKMSPCERVSSLTTMFNPPLPTRSLSSRHLDITGANSPQIAVPLASVASAIWRPGCPAGLLIRTEIRCSSPA